MRATGVSVALAAVVAGLFVVCGQAAYYEYGPSPADYGILQLPGLRNSSLNLVLGWRQYGDRLLHRQTVYKGSRLWSTVTYDFKYPPPGAFPRPANITAVYAINLKRENGAIANLTEGGVGARSVGIHFQSQRGHGIKFLVEIYGK